MKQDGLRLAQPHDREEDVVLVVVAGGSTKTQLAWRLASLLKHR
jgi:hypothetical protein